MKTWHQMFLAAGALMLAHWPAAAEDHPYAGLWSEAAKDNPGGLPGLSPSSACYNKFTEQLPDGRFRYYLVDHAKWLSDKKIEYLLAQEGSCVMDAGGRSEKCVGHVMGEKQSEWFIAYQEATSNEIHATYYENRFYFEQRVYGAPLARTRCPFDAAAIKKFISGKSIADCTTRCRAFGPSEVDEFKRMLEQLTNGKSSDSETSK